jgi:lysine 2,3-aminomutase
MKTGKNCVPCRNDIFPEDWSDWRWQSRHRLHTREQLVALIDYPASASASYEKLISAYPYGITPYYLSLVDLTDADDPIARQCFPDLREMDHAAGESADPLAEEQKMPLDGLMHRYADRCLVMVTNACATYCRHCNRKRRWGKNARGATKTELQVMIGYVAQNPVIREVIISGGDPLMLNEALLDWFIGALRSLPNVEVIRIASRMPVVMPMRITKRLCSMLRRHRPLWFNTQFNHAREITEDSARACAMLLEAGLPLSNQSVLLKGINDSYEAMQALLYGLQRIGVRPYYLFQADAVAGTHHLRADMERGIEMMGKLRSNISGLCLPNYVLDTPGERGKIPLERVLRQAQDERGQCRPLMVSLSNHAAAR